MKLSAIALLAFSLSGMAVAAPSSIPSDMSPLSQDLASMLVLPLRIISIKLVPQANNVIVISLAQPDASCSLLKCAKVVGEAACIIEAIKKKSGKDLFKCAKKDNVGSPC